MTISIVQSSTLALGTTSCTLTWPSATTANNLLVIGVMTARAKSPPTITVPGSWVLAGSLVTSGVERGGIYYIENAPSQTDTGAFTIGGIAPLIRIAGYEVSGIATSGSLDKTSSNNNVSGTTLDSGTTATTSQADEFSIAVIGQRIAATFSAPTNGYSISVQGNNAAANTMGVLNKILSATVAANTSVTSTQSAGWAGAIATFKSAGGGSTLTGDINMQSVLQETASGILLVSQSASVDLKGVLGI